MTATNSLNQQITMKPILFSTPMVQAILEGRKSMSRRIVKLKHIPNSEVASIHLDGSGLGWVAWSPKPVSAEETARLYPGNEGFKCPYGQPGDILWVRETWQPCLGTKNNCCVELIKFKADGFELPVKHLQDYSKTGWHDRPGIFLPQKHCRLFLKIISIRVEKLQDISQEDAKAEGIYPAPHRPAGEGIDCTPHADHSLIRDCYVCSYRAIWNSINAPKFNQTQWDANRWVWVIEFERIEKP